MPKGLIPRVTSRRSPLLRDRPRGVWQSDLVDKIRAYPKTQEAFDAKQARCREQIIRLNAEGRAGRNGVPDGWAGRKAEINKIVEAAKAEAKVIVDKMIDEKTFAPDCREARLAMEAAVEILCASKESEEPEKTVPLYQAATRLQAMRLVMEYAQRKPVTKSELAIAKPEDFLAMLVTGTDDTTDDGGQA